MDSTMEMFWSVFKANPLNSGILQNKINFFIIPMQQYLVC